MIKPSHYTTPRMQRDCTFYVWRYDSYAPNILENTKGWFKWLQRKK